MTERSPGPAAASEDQLLDHIRAHGSTVFHPVGTCAMGAGDSPLDEHCRVRGISGLRVIDASAMPTIVSGNTNSAILMIAERMADQIKSTTAADD